jgi:hypothetical protein
MRGGFAAGFTVKAGISIPGRAGKPEYYGMKNAVKRCAGLPFFNRGSCKLKKALTRKRIFDGAPDRA